MKSRVRVAQQLIALTLLLAQSPLILSQTNQPVQPPKQQPQEQQPPPPAATATVQDWQGLHELKPGKKVLVEFKSGSTLDAKFVGVNGSKLTLSEQGSDYNLEQRDIQRVYRLKGRWSRGKAARVGAGIGMLVGVIIGTRIMLRAEGRVGHIPSDADGGPPVAGFILGTMGGAGAGALLGGKRRGQLLYEAK